MEMQVRWERLFDDLEAQAAAHDAAEFDAEVSERSRYEVGQVTLTDRLRAAAGHPIVVRSHGAGMLRGRLDRVGAGWFLLEEQAGRGVLVNVAAVTSITGLGASSTPRGSEGSVGARLDLRHALRGIARDRSPVQAVLVDSTAVIGTLDRIGADFAEIAEHALGEPRRAEAVVAVHTVPLQGIAAVRRW
jgi:hypothetical protein